MEGLGERFVGDDILDKGAEAVGPIRRQKSAGNVDPLVFGIGPDEFGKEGEIFLEQVDMEITGCMVGVAEDFELLFGR